MNSTDPSTKTDPPVYTCTEYREEMILLGLKRKLSQLDTASKDRPLLEAEIERLEKEMGLD